MQGGKYSLHLRFTDRDSNQKWYTPWCLRVSIHNHSTKEDARHKKETYKQKKKKKKRKKDCVCYK